ncbi:MULTISPECIES: cell division protein ZapA [Pseudomonas]|uniref:Cell division protein ZapA n=1 Tax=Pseudomonas eucalypticola TaxID=2599595 RepID=A0A7D5DB39_9PSED|nr:MULTISPECIES: cell division protein ZapA [Pseudomonas]QKZ07157.1 cell division protein ZapA [Pseudomonas eucalypticola]
MSTDQESIKVVSILGNDYSLKAPPGEEQKLLDATRLLNASLAETKRKYPSLIGDKLLVLAALNLCSKQLDMQQQHAEALNRYQEQVNATVDVIKNTISHG